MEAIDEELLWHLPVFRINYVKATIESEGKIYARLIEAENKLNQKFILRERTGLEVEKYSGQVLECVVEITKAQFYSLEDKDLPSGVIDGIFSGNETGYKFFPDLVNMIDKESEDPDEDGDFNEDEYEELATKLFSAWGDHGFGLDIYRDKPMIKTENGTFLLNEFIFETLIENWEESLFPSVPVCFVIEELLLHGIKPYEGKWESQVKKTNTFEREEGESYIVGKPKFLEKYG